MHITSNRLVEVVAADRGGGNGGGGPKDAVVPALIEFPGDHPLPPIPTGKGFREGRDRACIFGFDALSRFVRPIIVGWPASSSFRPDVCLATSATPEEVDSFTG